MNNFDKLNKEINFIDKKINDSNIKKEYNKIKPQLEKDIKELISNLNKALIEIKKINNNQNNQQQNNNQNNNESFISLNDYKLLKKI